MTRDKAVIAHHVRSFARQVEPLNVEIAQRISQYAGLLDKAHAADLRDQELANRGTVECPLCNGLRHYMNGGGVIQCPRCRGWGREIEEV